MNLTRILPLALSLALLAGCSGGDKPALSAEARTRSPSIWISWA